MHLIAFFVLLYFVHGSSKLDPFYILNPEGVEVPSINNGVDYGKYLSKIIGMSVALGGCHLSGPETVVVVDLELYKSPIEKRQASPVTGCTSNEAANANGKLSQTNAFEFNTFFKIKKCGKLAEPFGGTWKGELKSENETGTIVEIICSNGFSLEDNIDPKVKCTDGHWSKLPNCTQTICPELKIANADVTYSKPANSALKERQEGSEASLKCHENYNVHGSVSATCQNGQWSPTSLGSCEKNDPKKPGPEQQSKGQDAFPVWAIVLICVGAVGICCMIICCICRSKNYDADDDEDEDVEYADQSRTCTRASQTMPSMNLRINVDENNLGDEMFNSSQFNIAIKNMNDIEFMMHDFGDQVDHEDIEVIDGTEKILSTAGEAREAEKMLEKFEEVLDQEEKMLEKFEEALDQEEKSLEDVEKIMEEGTERVEEALSAIDGLESVEKTELVTVEKIENVESDGPTESVQKIDKEKYLSFSEEELEEMMNMNQHKDFKTFTDSAEKSDQSLREAEDRTKGTISALLSEELNEINAMMNEEPLDFDSFKLTMSD